MITLVSALEVSTCLLFGEKAISITFPECPVNVCISSPVIVLHILAVES